MGTKTVRGSFVALVYDVEDDEMARAKLSDGLCEQEDPLGTAAALTDVGIMVVRIAVAEVLDGERY